MQIIIKNICMGNAMRGSTTIDGIAWPSHSCRRVSGRPKWPIAAICGGLLDQQGLQGGRSGVRRAERVAAFVRRRTRHSALLCADY